MKRISLARGLVLSQIITVLLEENQELSEVLEEKDISVDIHALQNGREQGFSYSVLKHGKDLKSFTWCTYEHRNSDQIIINGKEGYLTSSGDLPYAGDKWKYIACFGYNDYSKAADALAKEIINFLERK